MGNTINAGDTISIYRVKEAPLYSCRAILFDISDPNSKPVYLTPEPEKKKLNQYTWDLVTELGPLFEREGGLYFETPLDGMMLTVQIQVALFFYAEDEVICIKGKSDNEQEYYKAKFEL